MNMVLGKHGLNVTDCKMCRYECTVGRLFKSGEEIGKKQAFGILSKIISSSAEQGLSRI